MTPRCLHCLDEGLVCEDHPEVPWEGACPACCPPIPQDGTRSIAEAFVPGWQRAGAP